MSLERSKKLKKLAEAMSEAGIGKGVAGATTKTESKSSKVQALKKAETRAINNDGLVEQQVAKRYEKVGVSPIYSKGNFNKNSNNVEEKLGSRLTEDDKVSSTSKKRARRQY